MKKPANYTPFAAIENAAQVIASSATAPVLTGCGGAPVLAGCTAPVLAGCSAPVLAGCVAPAHQQLMTACIDNVRIATDR